MPDAPNRKGPQVRKPSKCLNGRSYEKRLPKEAFRSPATRGLKKDSDRAITPAVEAVCAPAHLTPPGSPQAKQLHHLHAQPPLGQSHHRQKGVLHLSMQGCFSRVQLFTSLWAVDCQASLSGRFSLSVSQYWTVLVNTGCHTLLEHCISCCISHQLP